jgi:hypothetical protein
MKGRRWKWPALAAVLVAGHGVILYYMSSRVMRSVGVAVGLLILVGLRHRGLLRRLRTPSDRRSRRAS